MKNKLSDLNDHLFMQIERLSDEDLDTAGIEKESKRSEAMVAVAQQIISNASLSVKAAKILSDYGLNPETHLPALERKN